MPTSFTRPAKKPWKLCQKRSLNRNHNLKVVKKIGSSRQIAVKNAKKAGEKGFLSFSPAFKFYSKTTKNPWFTRVPHLKLPAGFEPATYALRMRRSTSWAKEAILNILNCFKTFMTSPGIEPGFTPWEGVVLTAWPRGRIKFMRHVPSKPHIEFHPFSYLNRLG